MIRRSERNLRWPNLFVVGAAKAGTTSLAYYLGQHPDIFMSPIKEPHFFSGVTPRLFEAEHDEQAYLRLFDGSRGERYLGEASTSYLDRAKAAPAIAHAVPEARIVISLRNPIDRAYSGYWGSVRLGETRPFLELVQEAVANKDEQHGLVRRGLYADQVERYLSVFGPDRVRVLVFEELVSDLRLQLTELFRFLGIDSGVAREIRTDVQNPFSLPRGSFVSRLLGSARMRRAARRVVPLRLRAPVEDLLLHRPIQPPMDPRARELLKEAFAPDTERLQRVLGRPVPWAGELAIARRSARSG